MDRFRHVERKEIQWHFFRVAGGPEEWCSEEMGKMEWVWAVEELKARLKNMAILLLL